MSIARYEAENLFFNANFKEATSDGSGLAYRGELILKEGEIADAQGRRKPPSDVMKQAICFDVGGAVKLFAGSLDELQQLPLLAEKFGKDMGPDTLAIVFVVNLTRPMKVLLEGASYIAIPLTEGVTWNELSDIAALDKGDFKGLSAADKVQTLYQALQSHRFTFPDTQYADALSNTNHAKRNSWGAV